MLLKYEEIAESLRARITAGEFSPGDALPSGRVLAEEWGVSRATAIKAMEVLRADGVAVARQGTGFIVPETPTGRPAGGRRAGVSRVTGGMSFVRLGAPDWAVPPARVATALGLDAETNALRRVRLMHLPDGSPQSYVVAWFPADVVESAPRLAQTAPIAEGTTRYVRRETGRAPAEGKDVVTVRLATATEMQHLALTEVTAVAVVLHTAYDEEGHPLVCEEGVTPSTFYEHVETYPM